MRLLIAYFFACIIHICMLDNNHPGALKRNDKSQKPLFSFGIVADIQYCDCEPIGTRYYRSAPEKLREAMTILKADSVSFVINLGDIIDRDFRSYKNILDIMDSSGMKIYHVAGNHDYSVDQRFKKRLPVLTPSKEGYYSFVYNKFRFICLNGNELSTYISNNKTSMEEAQNNLKIMKEKGEINAVDWNGGLSKRQIKWFIGELDEAVAEGEKVFIICHFPLAPDNVHNLLNYKEVLPLLENYTNIIAWFNGHNHAGNYINFKSIHFFTFKGMVETESDNSFARVDVYEDRLGIIGYGMENSRILYY
jgi:manganese-dependent ADP-ribose/CDP-alcohol diphosphatase